jgi:hypothetical protein
MLNKCFQECRVWYTPVIPVLRRWKQEHLEFKTSLGYETLSQKNKPKKFPGLLIGNITNGFEPETGSLIKKKLFNPFWRRYCLNSPLVFSSDKAHTLFHEEEDQNSVS